MNVITEIEDAFIEALTAPFMVNGRSVLKAIDSLPGEFDEDSLKIMGKQSPALYVLFLGGHRIKQNNLALMSYWSVYAVTSHAGAAVNRRRGDGRQLGAYEILARALPVLDSLIVPGHGRCVLDQVQNLYTGHLERRGFAAYAARLSLPMALPAAVDPADLDGFVTYHADYADSAARLPLPPGSHPATHIDLEQD